MSCKDARSTKNLSHSIQEFEVDLKSLNISFRTILIFEKVSLEKYYSEHNIYAKFVEFEEYLELRASSKQFIRTVALNRLNSLLMTLICATVLGYYYIWRLHGRKKAFFSINKYQGVSNAINCLLPEVYWYKYMPNAAATEPIQEQIWTTTQCYFKSLGTWERFAEILFVLYLFMALFQIIFALSSSYKWKQADRLIKYLPLNCALNRKSVSDLHLLVAKVSENEGARKVQNEKKMCGTSLLVNCHVRQGPFGVGKIRTRRKIPSGIDGSDCLERD